MKTKTLFGISGLLLMATIAFSSTQSKTLSLNDLTAKASTAHCVEADNSDCKSGATSNIYIGYKLGAEQSE